jgi:hypothetical protein
VHGAELSGRRGERRGLHAGPTVPDLDQLHRVYERAVPLVWNVLGVFRADDGLLLFERMVVRLGHLSVMA